MFDVYVVAPSVVIALPEQSLFANQPPNVYPVLLAPLSVVAVP